MAETKTEAQAATTTAAVAASESAPDTTTGAMVADLAKVDPKALQSYVDQHVQKALKTREQNLAAEKAAALKKAEQEAAVARGDFDTVRKQLEAEKGAIAAQAQAQRVAFELKLAAITAGINDPEDVRLLPDDVLTALTDDKGAINRAAVAKAIEALKTSKGYLFKAPATAATAPAPTFAGAPSPGAAVPAAPSGDVTADQILKARQAYSQRVRNPGAPSMTDLLRQMITPKS